MQDVRALGRGARPRSLRAGSATTLTQRIRRAAEVLLSLSEADLRSRYGRGGVRMVKWLLDPFAALGVYLLFVSIARVRPGEAPGLSIACAVVPFQLLMMSIVNALNVVDFRRSIVLNMRFDRSLLPLSSVLTETVAFAASLLLIVLMMAGYRVAPTGAAVWLPLVLVITVVAAVGVAYPASLLGLWFSDLRQFAVSAVRTLFFAAPGFFALAHFGELTRTLLRINPLTGIFESYRSILLYGHRPAAWQLLIPLGYALVLLVAFVPVYRREQAHFARIVG
jgi:ABC-type polysaccharide/polyol phosphate export permease